MSQSRSSADYITNTSGYEFRKGQDAARQWAGIERAMNFANHNPAFRPQVESLVNTYFALIDEMAAELERRRVTRTVSLED